MAIKKFIHRYKIVFGILLIAFLIGLYFRSLFKELPSPETLREYRPTLSTKLYDIHGELITELFTERRTWVELSKIPPVLQSAVISIEDHRFYKHPGFVFLRIIRSAIENFIKRRFVAGGSTITQQLAKLAFLTQERTLRRKIKEFILALQLEHNFSKQEILEMYLNQVYLGQGAYGVEQASRIYFNKSVETLTLSEAATLAGLIRYPSYCSPIKHPDRALTRRVVVLDRMEKLNYITTDEKIQALKEPLEMSENVVSKIGLTKAPYFVEYVRLQLEQEYGPEIYQSGWKVYTTLDLQLQTTAEIIVDKLLSKFDEQQKYRFSLKKSTFQPVQCALLAVDVKTGQVRSLIGGRDFRKSQFNRAVQAYRQPGSAFKPFVYTAAIERGYTPVSIIEDTPLVYVNDGRDWRLKSTTTDYLLELPEEWLKNPLKVWVPENYKKKYYGNVLLRRALELSLNACAIRTIGEISPVTVIDYARKFGIKSPLTNTLSLALGASDVTLVEMVQAFNVFANRGIKTIPYCVVKIEDNAGRIIKQNYPWETDVLSEQTCFVMTNLLKGVIKNGTGKYASYFLKAPAAGKTGTTNEFTDAWFIGYTPKLTCGVWVGYDDKKTLGEKNTGGVVACPIWTEFMVHAHRQEPIEDFPTPATGISYANIDAATGLLATSESKNVYTEVFLSGTEPKTSLASSSTEQFLQIIEEEEEAGF
ncbi:MAG: PBP1A family penicillin-binding protein [Elusimicrobiota bacterium]|nr:PBP1A family penicillin-binding protein [Elusimicrobiota bacterium]